MSSNSVKLGSANNWHRQLGSLNQADVVMNTTERVGELDDVFDKCALAKMTKTPVRIVAETHADEKNERVFTDVIRFSRVVLLSGYPYCIVFVDQCTMSTIGLA